LTSSSSPSAFPHRNRRESQLKTQVAIRALTTVLLAIGLAWPIAVHADPPPPPTYVEAVQSTIDIVAAAHDGDVGTAQRAVGALVAGTGHSQPEIIADLQMRPPDFADAYTRLRALLDLLNAPLTTADPAQASQRLQDVLSMSRYRPLHQPPTLLDRLGQWARDRINDLLRFLFGGRGGPVVPPVYFYIVGIVAVAVAAVVIFRAARGRMAEVALSRAPMGPHSPADFFAEADRLAAAGDRIGAIRSLCAGVAASLAGEQSWTGSPLTVREIFQRAPEPARLRPLLRPFEAAVYGGRDVDPAAYSQAEVAAAPFRKPPAEAAA
jgi:hypothetical protein